MCEDLLGGPCRDGRTAPDLASVHRSLGHGAPALVLAGPERARELARLARLFGYRPWTSDLPRDGLGGAGPTLVLHDGGVTGGSSPGPGTGSLAVEFPRGRPARSVPSPRHAGSTPPPPEDIALLAAALSRTAAPAARPVDRCRDFGAAPLPPGSLPAGDSGPRSAYAREIASVARHGPVRALVVGPAGTDKLFAAGLLHDASDAAGETVLVRCAWEAEGGRRFLARAARGEGVGHLERAAGGTLVLDDVSALPLHLQSLVIAAVESGRLPGGEPGALTSWNLVAVLREPLGRAFLSGRLHRDLYYALARWEVRVPGLDETGDDLEAIVRSMVAAFDLGDGRTGAPTAVDDALLEAVRRGRWAGNHAELRAFLGALHARTAPGAPLRPDAQARRALEAGRATGPGIRVGTTLAATRREWLEETLRRTDGNNTRAGRLLGVSPRTIYSLRKAIGTAAPA